MSDSATEEYNVRNMIKFKLETAWRWNHPLVHENCARAVAYWEGLCTGSMVSKLTLRNDTRGSRGMMLDD